MTKTAYTVAALAAALALALPGAAHAAPSQFSIIQDDAAFTGFAGDPGRWFAEARALGADMVRLNVYWRDVAPGARSLRKPAGHDVSDPTSPGYDWSIYDRAIRLARAHGLQVLATLSGPVPYWGSHEPRRCARGRRPLHCVWKPDAREFGHFVAAAARRWRGQVRMWSIWNEPNLSSWLKPRHRRTRHGRIHCSGRMYRKLWLAGWRAIAKNDPRRRRSVLFGETAATHEPVRLLRAALCLDARGRPFRGKRRRGQGCSRRPRKLPIGGIAHHPYNQAATGSPRKRARSRWSLPAAQLPRLHRLIRGAARRGRIPRKPIYVTEYGFQSRPPDRLGVSLRTQARYINAAERLFYRDRRVRSVAQYEIVDPPDPDVFNTGLRTSRGKAKPAWRAWRMPLFVSRRGKRTVEVWGQVRPANGRVRVTVRAWRRPWKGSRRVARPRTNSRGYFRVTIRGRRAHKLRFRTRWRTPSGEVIASRSARVRKPIRYLR